jgi:hypothetical protein
MRSIAVLAAAITLAVAGVADAKQNFKIVASSGTIHGHLAQPATAQGYRFAGFVSDSKLGEGATTSRGSLDGLTTSGTLTVFLDKDTLRATFHFKVTPNADGTVTFQGTTKYTGGTGAYKGARGSGQTTATQDTAGYTTFQYTQTLKLPKR